MLFRFGVMNGELLGGRATAVTGGGLCSPDGRLARQLTRPIIPGWNSARPISERRPCGNGDVGCHRIAGEEPTGADLAEAVEVAETDGGLVERSGLPWFDQVGARA